MSERRDLLDPAVALQLDKLEVIARTLVEGFIRGLHESASKGSSIEFAEHRQYMPGDPLKHLDWKVYGKTDRLYVKRYEEETNLEAHLVVDHNYQFPMVTHFASEPHGYMAAPDGDGIMIWLPSNLTDAMLTQEYQTPA